MSKINRGKQFEEKIKEQLEKIPEISVDRLYDITMGYKNINNPCDFIVFDHGTLNYIECKAIHGNTLNFKSHIRKNQWEKLLKKSYIPGVNAGILVWFIDHDRTGWLDIMHLQYLLEDGKKSFNITKDFFDYELKGKKKKVFFEYDLENWLKEWRY